MKGVLQDLLHHSDDKDPTLWVMHPKQKPTEDDDDHVMHPDGFDTICGDLNLERRVQLWDFAAYSKKNLSVTSNLQCIPVYIDE